MEAFALQCLKDPGLNKYSKSTQKTRQGQNADTEIKAEDPFISHRQNAKSVSLN